jgi:hypothetical protein
MAGFNMADQTNFEMNTQPIVPLGPTMPAPVAVPPPVVPPMQSPELQAQQPLIPREMLSQLLAKALGTPQASPEDMVTAKFKIAQALLQPRMQGQSVAGNIGNALGAGVDTVNASQERARQQAVQNAQLASTIGAQDTQTRQAEMSMAQAAQKFPLEMKKLTEEVQQLKVEGRIKEAQAIVAEFQSNPARLLEDYKTKLEKTRAETGKAEAEAKKATAEATIVAPAHAAYYTAAGEAERNRTAALDNTKVQMLNTPDGVFEYDPQAKKMRHIRPGLTQAEAFAQAKKELDSPWGPTPTEKIRLRAQELMQPKAVPVDLTGTGVAPATAAAAAPAQATPSATTETSVRIARRRADGGIEVDVPRMSARSRLGADANLSDGDKKKLIAGKYRKLIPGAGDEDRVEYGQLSSTDERLAWLRERAQARGLE